MLVAIAVLPVLLLQLAVGLLFLRLQHRLRGTARRASWPPRARSAPGVRLQLPGFPQCRRVCVGDRAVRLPVRRGCRGS